MAKSTYIILILTFFFRLTNAQLTPAKIADNIQEADEYIFSEDYNEALIILNNLRNQGYENSNINFKTGFCYLNIPSEKNKALQVLKKASENISKNYNPHDPAEINAPLETWLYLGDAYRQSNNFAEAVKCYKQFANESNIPAAQEISRKRIKECHVARLLQRKPVDVKWETLPSSINQGIANLNPVLSADGSTMVFTRKMKFYDAVFISYFKDNSWQEPVNITTQIGSDGEFYPSGLSSDGKRLLMSSYNILSGQDIYESIWTGSRWTKLKKLDESINSKYVEESACYSPDSKTILFASNRENGFGGYDIYKSELRADGSWSRPINLGPSVNTSADEKSPRLLNNGNTLVFSSRGHLTMGGFDLFYTDYPIQSNSVIRNLGYPLNTVNNDLSFYPLLSENVGFAARPNEDGNGESNIYLTRYSGFSNIGLIPVKTSFRISGINPNDSVSLMLVDALINDTLEQKTTYANTESVDYTLYPGSFLLIAEASGRKPFVSNFTVPENLKSSSYQIPLSVDFKEEQSEVLAASEKTTLLIRNITFGFNSFALEADFHQQLDRIADILSKNPDVLITLTGYTDNIGPETYNKILSCKRAESVMQYLNQKGIEKQRIKTIGAGNTAFIAINNREEGRKFNRRVEIRFENKPQSLELLQPTEIPEKLKIK